MFERLAQQLYRRAIGSIR
ncbi:unnamed protein product, partial [Rotaria socialis]